MKRSIVILCIFLGGGVFAQKIDSICFHLYTDSLKKGSYNYINVDARLADGSWRPLTAKDLNFTSSAFSFSNNELIIPADCREEKVVIGAALISNPILHIEKTVWIKQRPDPDTLPAGNNKSPSNKREAKRNR